MAGIAEAHTASAVTKWARQVKKACEDLASIDLASRGELQVCHSCHVPHSQSAMLLPAITHAASYCAALLALLSSGMQATWRRQN